MTCKGFYKQMYGPTGIILESEYTSLFSANIKLVLMKKGDLS